MDEITKLKEALNIPTNSRISSIGSFLCSKVKGASEDHHNSKIE